MSPKIFITNVLPSCPCETDDEEDDFTLILCAWFPPILHFLVRMGGQSLSGS